MENISVKNVTMALTSVVSMSEMALLRMTSKAVLKNGILTLTVPKKEAKPAVEEKKYIISIEG